LQLAVFLSARISGAKDKAKKHFQKRVSNSKKWLVDTEKIKNIAEI
jgi:hypothetical protein